jgi:putative ABC transport system ATP-binding protein
MTAPAATGLSTAAVELIGVTKRFGQGDTAVHALDDVSMRVERAEFVALMGPSGCGKSTLLHLAGGLEAPTSGRVLVNGRDLADLDLSGLAALRRNEVAYVFQRLNLLAALTALENVSLPLELDGVPVKAARSAAREALAAVGLTQQLDRFPDDFSGGQQQRIAIARAIAGARSVLLADEPTGSLDTRTGDDVIEVLANLPERFGTSVVLVTHEPRFASWTDRVLFLRDGVVVDQACAPAAAVAR